MYINGKISTANIKDVDYHFSVKLNLFVSLEVGDGLNMEKFTTEKDTTEQHEETNNGNVNQQHKDRKNMLRKIKYLKKFAYRRRKKKKSIKILLGRNEKRYNEKYGKKPSKKVSIKRFGGRNRNTLILPVIQGISRNNPKWSYSRSYHSEVPICSPTNEENCKDFDVTIYLIINEEFFGYPVRLKCTSRMGEQKGVVGKGVGKGVVRKRGKNEGRRYFSSSKGNNKDTSHDALNDSIAFASSLNDNEIAEDLQKILRSRRKSGSIGESEEKGEGKGESEHENEDKGEVKGGRPPRQFFPTRGNNTANKGRHSIRNNVFTIRRTVKFPLKYGHLSAKSYLLFVVQNRINRDVIFYGYCSMFTSNGVLRQGIQIRKLYFAKKKSKGKHLIVNALKRKISHTQENNPEKTNNEKVIAFLRKNCIYGELLKLCYNEKKKVKIEKEGKKQMGKETNTPVNVSLKENLSHGIDINTTLTNHSGTNGKEQNVKKFKMYRRKMLRIASIFGYNKQKEKERKTVNNRGGNNTSEGKNRIDYHRNCEEKTFLASERKSKVLYTSMGRINNIDAGEEGNTLEIKKRERHHSLRGESFYDVLRRYKRVDNFIFSLKRRSIQNCEREKKYVHVKKDATCECMYTDLDGKKEMEIEIGIKSHHRMRKKKKKLFAFTYKGENSLQLCRHIVDLYKKWKMCKKKKIAGYMIFHFHTFNKDEIYYNEKKENVSTFHEKVFGAIGCGEREEATFDHTGRIYPNGGFHDWFFDSFDYVGEMESDSLGCNKLFKKGGGIRKYDEAYRERASATCSGSEIREAAASRSEIREAAASRSEICEAAASRSEICEAAASRSEICEAATSRSKICEAAASRSEIREAAANSGNNKTIDGDVDTCEKVESIRNGERISTPPSMQQNGTETVYPTIQKKGKKLNDIFEHISKYTHRISKNVNIEDKNRYDDYPFDLLLKRQFENIPALSPSVSEIKTLNTVLNTPIMKMQEYEKRCLWKYRLHLINRKETLGKFLKCVNWKDKNEKEEAIELLTKWSKPCLENCLELFNSHMHIQVVKKYIINIIRNTKKEQLKLYLFQLVQCLRTFNYEPIDDLFINTLIRKCVKSKKLSIFLHWFLLSETKNKEKGKLYVHIHKLFINTLIKSSLKKKKDILTILKNQNRFRNQLLYLTLIAKNKSDRIQNKTKKLRQFLFYYRQNYGYINIKQFIQNNIFLTDKGICDFSNLTSIDREKTARASQHTQNLLDAQCSSTVGNGISGDNTTGDGQCAFSRDPEIELDIHESNLHNSIYYLSNELKVNCDMDEGVYNFEYRKRSSEDVTSDIWKESSNIVNYIDDLKSVKIERNRDSSFFSNFLQFNDNFDFFLSSTYNSDEDNNIEILDDSISIVQKQKIKKINTPLILPIDPNTELLSFLPEQSYVLRSSLYPIVIACLVRKKIKLSQEKFHNLIINKQKYLKRNIKKKKNYSLYHSYNSKFVKALNSSFDYANDFEYHCQNVSCKNGNIFYRHRKVERVHVSAASVFPCAVEPVEPVEADTLIDHSVQGGGESRRGSNTSRRSAKKYNEIYELSIKKYIYKAGDDLRQDHLVIQVIYIIDNIWKRYGLNLKLTLYRVLALSTDDGFIEFVDYAESISSIKKNYRGEIRQYFINNSVERNTPLGFDAYILENFISSCAGYSVITYILGIGDRHLDNLMVSKDGCFFHIDFGYIFGEDPKPFSPPMKLCKEMIEAMGGAHSLGYEQFLKKCCLAYKYLRYHSKLIIYLLDAMSESGLKDMKMNPEVCVQKVQEKFRLDLNDEAAEIYFLSVINASVKTLFPVVVDKLHEWALNWK
ncbi:phosphatidylinositol 3-kinase, putative [Plasmodium ovale curtisi]|uniref:phosphatidylinositol 3-kinase n=1 Tax=Plasmodium ovale curtisi TaxID=864141 RepID=A0A1A8WIM1_PLAOA|nr:phosphatidylinositol 3-kinase, putative [Plasmodium ovale curtisi]